MGCALFAIVAIVPAWLAGASPALAETIGGEQLAATNRTVNLLAGASPLPEVWAETWLIADAETGEVLAHKGAHVKRAPASTLKMLTALAVMPRTSLDQEYVVTRRATDTYGSKVGLKVGRAYTMDQLWRAVFLPSANDAAIAVAEANGGVRTTVAQMNDIARSIGALDTVAKNTSGLDAPGQVSSAYDLALFARAGLEREDFARYARTARAKFPDSRGRGQHTIYTTNRMLLHGWRGAIGVKTGFTSAAGRTFVGAAERKGRTLIVALMGVKESSEGAATKLLGWGFKNADRVEPVGVLVDSVFTDAAIRAGEEDGGKPTAAAEESSSGEDAPATSTPVADPPESLDLREETNSAASMLPAGIVGLAMAIILGIALLLIRRHNRGGLQRR